MAKKKTKKKDKKKDKKSILAKLKIAAKKNSKKKDSKKKDSKKKDSKKKKASKKNKPVEKVVVEKPLRAKFAQQKVSAPPPKPAPKPVPKPAAKTAPGKVDHSTNYKIKEAIQRLRAIKNRDEFMVFVKGEKRITVTKVIPAALNRLKS